MDRRQFLASGAAVAASPILARTPGPQTTAQPKGKAEHVIFLWLGGGMAQIDTFDPKSLGNNKANPKKPGSAYAAIDTTVPDVKVCEHLKKTARMLEHMTIVRTVHHDTVDEHAAATNRVHTGRPTSGNIVYPSIGSIIAHERGAAQPGVPAYVLMGYPNVSRGPGFLGSKANCIYLTDTEAGPAGLKPPEGIDGERASRRQRLAAGNGTVPDALKDYEQAQRESQRLAGPDFQKLFQLREEPTRLRESYGGEFGQRCLLARRLVQAGVRFIEVSHNLNFLNGTGWDTHNEGQENQHLLIQELDTAFATLLEDLQAKKLLEKTLVVIGTEFGRPPEFDGRGGRGHQGSCFSLVLAGGGLKHCGAFGQTDDLSKKIVEKPVSVPDFHATIHAAMGIDPAKELMDGSRPVPITDGGQAIRSLFS